MRKTCYESGFVIKTIITDDAVVMKAIVVGLEILVLTSDRKGDFFSVGPFFEEDYVNKYINKNQNAAGFKAYKRYKDKRNDDVILGMKKLNFIDFWKVATFSYCLSSDSVDNLFVNNHMWLDLEIRCSHDTPGDSHKLKDTINTIFDGINQKNTRNRDFDESVFHFVFSDTEMYGESMDVFLNVVGAFAPLVNVSNIHFDNKQASLTEEDEEKILRWLVDQKKKNGVKFVINFGFPIRQEFKEKLLPHCAEYDKSYEAIYHSRAEDAKNWKKIIEENNNPKRKKKTKKQNDSQSKRRKA